MDVYINGHGPVVEWAANEIWESLKSFPINPKVERYTSAVTALDTDSKQETSHSATDMGRRMVTI